MRKQNSRWRALRAICSAAVAVFGMALASATAIVGAYARFNDAPLYAASRGHRLWWSITGLIQRFINSVEADQVPELAPIGSVLGSGCYVGTDLSGNSRRDLVKLHMNARSTNGDSRKKDRLNS